MRAAKLARLTTYIFLGIGFVAVAALLFHFKVSADVISPGLASAKLNLEIESPSRRSVKVNAFFYPESGNLYYFAERTFHLEQGKNELSWVVKKLPAGRRKAVLMASGEFFQPPGRYLDLRLNSVADGGRFVFRSP